MIICCFKCELMNKKAGLYQVLSCLGAFPFLKLVNLTKLYILHLLLFECSINFHHLHRESLITLLFMSFTFSVAIDLVVLIGDFKQRCRNAR